MNHFRVSRATARRPLAQDICSMTSRHRGFTLIELLIVVVIIGILASIAIPKFANTKEKAYIATMKTDLRNLTSAMEAYYHDNNSAYATSTTILGTNFRASSGVTVTMGTVTATGWTATSAHSITSKSCSLTVGGTSTNEGEPVCR
jgi:prepilin-type N-terminal cleavage/methylation domain-containing protein